MSIKIILFITLLAYSVIVSQSFMYMLALKQVQFKLDADHYTEFRKLIDISMRSNFKYVIYAALFFNLLLVIMNFKTPGSLMFIASCIALVALVIDIALTLKGNLPINDVINSWTVNNVPSNWQEFRLKWFSIFKYRQIANIAGFISLLIAAVFGSR